MVPDHQTQEQSKKLDLLIQACKPSIYEVKDNCYEVMVSLHYIVSPCLKEKEEGMAQDTTDLFEVLSYLQYIVWCLINPQIHMLSKKIQYKLCVVD